MKKIVVGYGDIRTIAKILGCTEELVSKSLSYKKNSTLPRNIRKVVQERGGVQVEFAQVAKLNIS